MENTEIENTLAKYPCLKGPLTDACGSGTHKLTVNVETASEDWLHYRGRSGAGYICAEYPYGVKVEAIYAIDKEGNRIKAPDSCLIWGLDESGRQATTTRIHEWLSSAPFGFIEVEKLVFLTKYQWHKVKDPSLFRQPDYIEVNTAILTLPPGKTWSGLIKNVNVLENVRLDGKDIMNAAIRQEPTYTSVLSELDDLCKDVTRILQDGMYKEIDSTKARYLSGTFGGTKVLTGCLAGRLMVTLKDAESQITFITEDDWEYLDRTGWQSIESTLPTAKKLVSGLVSYWSPGVLKRDNEVSFG